MRLYETTFLLNPQVDDATLERQARDIVDIINDGGGKVLHETRLGTRRLAYDIQGLSQAYYHNIVFEAEAAVLPPIERHYRLNEAYLRHLTVQFEGDPDRLTAEIPSGPVEEETRPQPPRRSSDEGGPVGRRNAPAPVAAAVEKPAADEAEPEGDDKMGTTPDFDNDDDDEQDGDL